MRCRYQHTDEDELVDLWQQARDTGHWHDWRFVRKVCYEMAMATIPTNTDYIVLANIAKQYQRDGYWWQKKATKTGLSNTVRNG